MTLIYHITHYQNLKGICCRGGISCDSAVIQDGSITHVNIAYPHIKERRARREVPIPPGGTLADYVSLMGMLTWP